MRPCCVFKTTGCPRPVAVQAGDPQHTREKRSDHLKGLILAGGKGTRLFPLTRRVPRCLIPIQDRPVIHRPILLMKSAGIVDIVVNTHYHSKRVCDYLGTGEKLGVNISYSHEDALHGIGAAVRKAQPLLGDEPFVVMNGDVLADIDLSDVLTYHTDQHADATLVIRPEREARVHGPLDFDTDVSLSALLGEDPVEGSFLHPAGIRVLSPRVFEFLSTGTCFLGETFARMVGAGCHLEGYLSDGYWADLRCWEKYGHILWEIGRGFVPEAPVS
ncbi:MAG: nucleotidyltransferase family protein [Proteobacteria bacterium]|nr:nucleotidyltransferase family protein [Pseudomonadota bacterium]